MANRYFNKQTTNARQALAQGGPAKWTKTIQETDQVDQKKVDLH